MCLSCPRRAPPHSANTLLVLFSLTFVATALATVHPTSGHMCTHLGHGLLCGWPTWQCVCCVHVPRLLSGFSLLFTSSWLCPNAHRGLPTTTTAILTPCLSRPTAAGYHLRWSYSLAARVTRACGCGSRSAMYCFVAEFVPLAVSVLCVVQLHVACKHTRLLLSTLLHFFPRIISSV